MSEYKIGNKITHCIMSMCDKILGDNNHLSSKEIICAHMASAKTELEELINAYNENGKLKARIKELEKEELLRKAWTSYYNLVDAYGKGNVESCNSDDEVLTWYEKE